jgi:hypothetical protein
VTPEGAGPEGSGPEGTDPEGSGPEGSRATSGEAPPSGATPRRLSLGDPLDGRASEDRPEAWGDRGESDSDRLAHYRTQTPPHHG